MRGRVVNAPNDKRYLSRMPLSVPAGRVLVHGRMRSDTLDPAPNWDDFRAWTRLPGPDLVECTCNWSGLPHSRMRTENEVGS